MITYNVNEEDLQTMDIKTAIVYNKLKEIYQESLLTKTTRIHKDKEWIEGKQSIMLKRFPFLTGRSLARVLKSLENTGLIKIASGLGGNLDKTKWICFLGGNT